ncbi:MAG: GntR family transcriptional regulator [Armatimonadota bacterium]
MSKALRNKIADSIAADYIYNGQLAVGSALPTVRDLKERYGVSSGTLVSALAILEAQGIVKSRRGSGCYVTHTSDEKEQDTNNNIKCIGLICSSWNADIYKRLHSGVDNMCRENGYTVVLASTNYNYEEEQDQVDRMIEQGCEGIILYPVVRTKAQAAKDFLNSKHLDFPIVLVDLGLDSHKRSQVLFDNYRAGHEMTAFLLNKGHKRIAFMDYRSKENEFEHRSVKDRYNGYLAAMRASDSGIVPEDRWMLQGEMHDDVTTSVARLLLEWVEKVDRPTAVIALEDNRAALTISIAQELNIHVPGDLEVVGFDNLPIGRIIRPHITTTNPDFQRAGEIAVEILLKHLRNETQQQLTYVLPAPIKPREALSLQRVVDAINTQTSILVSEQS